MRTEQLARQAADCESSVVQARWSDAPASVRQRAAILGTICDQHERVGLGTTDRKSASIDSLIVVYPMRIFDDEDGRLGIGLS